MFFQSALTDEVREHPLYAYELSRRPWWFGGPGALVLHWLMPAAVFFLYQAVLETIVTKVAVLVLICFGLLAIICRPGNRLIVARKAGILTALYTSGSDIGTTIRAAVQGSVDRRAYLPWKIAITIAVLHVYPVFIGAACVIPITSSIGRTPFGLSTFAFLDSDSFREHTFRSLWPLYGGIPALLLFSAIPSDYEYSSYFFLIVYAFVIILFIKQIQRFGMIGGYLSEENAEATWRSYMLRLEEPGELLPTIMPRESMIERKR